MKKKRVFKRKSTYFYLLIFRLGVIALTVWWFSWVSGFREEELIKIFGYQDLIGSSGQRGSQAIQMLIVNIWGKKGIVVLASIFVLGALYYLIKEIREFRRFLRKDRLYKQGLVNNLYDDNPPPGFFKLIYLLFTRKKEAKTSRIKIDKKKIEKLKEDKLYKKLYGD